VHPDETAMINGCIINWVDQVRHLGNCVSNNLSDDLDCNIKCATFINSVNKLVGNYGNVSQDVLNRLFNVYCCSFYGSQLWDLNSKGSQKCYVSWNKAVRRILKLSNRTHTWLLGPLIGSLYIKVQLEMRTLSFMYNLLHSNNRTVHNIANIILSQANSTLGVNYSYLMHKYQISIYDDLYCNKSRIRLSNVLKNVDDVAIVCNVKTLMDCRGNDSCLQGFNAEEIDFMIEAITTSI
jgi:hypothetical protein